MSAPVRVSARTIPWLLAGSAILAQIAWPLTAGQARVATTQAVVCLFAAASVTHAGIWRGWAWAGRYTAVVLAFGFAVELLGTTTGFPFSPYEYTNVLQPQLLGVPLLIPAAWTMMAYPALLVGRTLGTRIPIRGAGRTGARRRAIGQVALGAWALASWDLFLDPQMVAEGYWRWSTAAVALPGVPGIPVINYLGWLLVSAILMAMLTRVLPAASDSDPADQGVPALLYGWTWIGGIVANAVFLGRPAVALWGGIGMGLVAVPYLSAVVGRRRA